MSNANFPAKQNYLNQPTTKSNFIAGGIFHLIGRAFDGIAVLHNDFKPAVTKVAKMLGTKAENVERQMILKRNYTESEAAIFYSFLSGFVKNYVKSQKKLEKDLEKIRISLGKADCRSLKQIRKTMKEEAKTNKLSEKLGQGNFEKSSNVELKSYWREEYSAKKVLEQQFKNQEWIIQEMNYEFKFVFKVLKKRYRKDPDLFRKVTDLQIEAQSSVC